MSRLQLLVVAGFIVAFLAGGAVGLLSKSVPAAPAVSQGRGQRHLAEELGLTTEQQEQMRRIWSEVMGGEGMRALRQRRSGLRRERTEAIEALLTPEQREQYERILAQYDRQSEQIGQESRRLIDQAVERTKAILTKPQAAKYEQMRQERRHKRGPGGVRRRRGDRGNGLPARPGEPGRRPGRGGADAGATTTRSARP